MRGTSSCQKPMNAQECLTKEPIEGDGNYCQPTCKVELFPKWKWMMDYCKANGMSPTMGWEIAEEKWSQAFEPNNKAAV